MHDIPFDAIGFDLDGTLLDTFRDLGAAVNHALVLGGFAEVSVETSKDLIGGGAKIMLARAVEAQGGVAEAEFRRLYKAMLSFYEAHNAVHTEPYPGVREGLAGLENKSLVVTHAGAMRAAVSVLTGQDHRAVWALDLPYRALLSLRIWPGKPLAGQIIGLETGYRE